MKKKYLTIILLSLGILITLAFQSENDTKKDEETFTIYLVRHSEKKSTASNPSLTKCGEQRSVNLKNFLNDVPLDAVYSTNYVRTKRTALPTAKSKELEIKEYNPEMLLSFSKLLLENKQDALVVGHSNTTGVLAGILVGEDIEAFDLDIYNRIYQVVIYKNNGRLHLLHTSFVCND
jgi:broad specificity phosphatase PhoE